MKAFYGDPKIKEKYLARVKLDLFIYEALNSGRMIADHDAGVVYSNRKAGLFKLGCINTRGYEVFTFHFNGVRKQIKTHRAIWISKHGIPPIDKVVDHINRNKLDNTISNLRLVDAKMNARNRRSYIGSLNPSAKIDKKIADAIRVYYKKFKSYKSAANAFNISRSLVASIIRNERWL